MQVVLISTYELGRQPFGLASPAAWLRDAGAAVACLDLARQPLDEDLVRTAEIIAFYLPMHTATRLAVPVIARVREINPAAHVCAFGLYAPVNADLLRKLGVGTLIGGEFEEGLVAALRRLQSGGEASPAPLISLARQRFVVPDRSGLPPLAQYAQLVLPGGARRTVGYTEASRGCKHLCRHCPVVPVYGGNFRVVQREVVLEDIRRQVAAGAQHITFGDPDPFGSKRSEDSLLAADGIFTSILTSYGFQAENRRLFDGIGLGYTLGVFDAFGRRDALNFGLGVAWFSDVHVLKDHVTPGRLLPSGSHSPTTQTAMTTPMLDIALHF